MTLRSKLAIVGASGLLFTGAAVGLAGVASAQNGGTTADTTAESTTTGETPGSSISIGQEAEDGYYIDIELSPEDEAVFARFDQCLADNGLDVVSIDGMLEDERLTDDEIDAAWEAFDRDADAAFDACEPILDDLSEEVQEIGGEVLESEEYLDYLGDDEWVEEFELSPEDEAVFERFDQCLVDNGVDELDEMIFNDEELTEEQLDSIDELGEQIYSTCEPILEELSGDAAWIIEDCPDHDEDDDEYEDGEDDGADVEELEGADS
ncbi:MAG: hypothetical protein AAGA65_21335 [Actinomycetota bacterium]